MNKEDILQAIKDHFNSVTPEEVINSLEELGCEFEDVKSYVIPYPHPLVSGEVAFVASGVSESIKMPGMNICGVTARESIVLGEPVKNYCSDDKTYDQLLDAA